MEITRFAPSPTGHLHLGGARTALFAWLHAKTSKGKFLLRFEDTDNERSKKEYVDSIVSSLSWLGIKPDDDPVYQSKNIELHKKIAFNLLDSGKAYSCDCSSEYLEEVRKKQIQNKLQPKYDGLNRDKNLSHKDGNVIRFKMPQSGSTSFEDKILGTISVNNKELDDFIILRSDSTPTYNFCAAIDDFDMKISTVIRGDDHITNTLKQINILNSINSDIPDYAHLPMVLSSEGKRLSKREGALDINEYKKMGYLQEAMINYLIKLGWTYKDQELFSEQELLEYFKINDVNSSPARFSQDLLNWYNNHYIKSNKINNLLDLIKNTSNINFNPEDNNKYLEIFKLMSEGANTLIELVDSSRFFYILPDYKDVDRSLIEESRDILSNFSSCIDSFSFESHESIETDIKNYIKSNELKFPQLGKPLRIILSGRENAPSISELVYLLGLEETRERIALFI
jgi:glutamyl-tRNA synthetase|tara:strand:+ start:15804 stop:17168 length:1365 start_codon:yes stop_codon:yes gene_type:complete